MTCGHCRQTVERALGDIKGVYGAHVDLQAGTAEVDYDDSRCSAADLTAAVEQAGYGAEVAS
jgi:copper chaperone CopZ